MKNTMKKNLVLGMAMLGAVAIVGGTATFVQAKAEGEVTPLTVSDVELTMDVGAAVRLQTTEIATNNKGNGMRFRMYLSVDDYAGLMANVGAEKAYSKVEFGMLIAPSSYELTKANVFGDEAIYDWATYNADEEIWQYDDTSAKTRIINITGTEVTDYALSATETVKQFTGSIVDVKETNLVNEFQGVGYIAYTTESGTDYLFATANDNVRSMTYIAQQLQTLNVAEEVKTAVATNYIEPVADVDTQYTVNHFVAKADGTYATEPTQTAQETAKINAEITVADNALAGYTVDAEKTAVTQATVFANAKTALNIYYKNPIAEGLADATTNWASEEYANVWVKDGSGSIAYSAEHGGILLSNAVKAYLSNDLLKAAVENGYTQVTIKVKMPQAQSTWWTAVQGLDSATEKAKNIIGAWNNSTAEKSATVSISELYYTGTTADATRTNQYVLYVNNINSGSYAVITSLTFTNPFGALADATTNWASEEYAGCFSGDVTYVEGLLAVASASAAARSITVSTDFIAAAVKAGYTSATFVVTTTSGDSWAAYYANGVRTAIQTSGGQKLTNKEVTVSFANCLTEENTYSLTINSNRNWNGAVAIQFSSFTLNK